jgi:thioredoxin reductase (NADPH)
MSQTPKVPIIGGGPAGMSCALWLQNYGLGPLIIERERALGGMARANPYPNPWLLGRPGALGRENAAEFARHIEEAAVETWFGGTPQRAWRRADGLIGLDVAFADLRPPRSLSCMAMVIATGTAFRGEEWLDQVVNARALAQQGRVHIGPGWAGEPGVEPGAHVALIGGGDNAFDVAHILLRKGVKVTIVMRAQAPKAQPLLVERLRAHAASGLVDVRSKQEVVMLDARGASLRARLSDGSDLDVDHVMLLFGYRPNSGGSWLAELPIDTDANGYIAVDGNMETSCWGIFAVGDVANPVHPCTATAIATGTMAAREIQKRFARHGAPSP